MESFTNYLNRNNYSNRTIKAHENRISRLLAYHKQKQINTANARFADMMRYIEYLQKQKGYTVTSINNEIRAIKLYYDYLMEENSAIDNPAKNLKIKGKQEKLLTNLLSTDELEDLYYSYETENWNSYTQAIKKRNKTIVGLLVYQGVKPNELYRIETEHIDIQKGKVIIPGSPRSEHREIALKAWQVLDFMEYLNEYREKLSKKQDHEHQLYSSTESKMNACVGTICKTLRQTNAKVINANQIRNSVIVNWLKQYNLRKVQVLAGHRYISSTEKYQQNDIESLHQMINQFHPLK